MRLSRAARIPGWWQQLTGEPVTKLGDLLVEVEHQGASPNDRTVVTRIWRQMQIQRALQRVQAAEPSDDK